MRCVVVAWNGVFLRLTPRKEHVSRLALPCLRVFDCVTMGGGWVVFSTIRAIFFVPVLLYDECFILPLWFFAVLPLVLALLGWIGTLSAWPVPGACLLPLLLLFALHMNRRRVCMWVFDSRRRREIVACRHCGTLLPRSKAMLVHCDCGHRLETCSELCRRHVLGCKSCVFDPFCRCVF